MRFLAIFFGLLLMLPGLCCVIFGVGFAVGSGTTMVGILETIVGGLITWGALALIGWGGK